MGAAGGSARSLSALLVVAQLSRTASLDAGEHPAAAGKHDRSNLYERLYADFDYHSSPKLTHAKAIIQHLVLKHYEAAEARARARVLDVGCSHGLGVNLLWNLGIHASGTDLAPTAVKMATRLRVVGPPPAGASELSWPCLRDDCFKVGSAAALPWANRSFDAILSTDVLEHVPPPLVPQVVREFSRVARSHLFLAIALEAAWEDTEEGRKYCATHDPSQPTVIKGRKHYLCFASRLGSAGREAAPVVHETVQPAAWWKHSFEEGGTWSCTLEKSEHAGNTVTEPHFSNSTAWMHCQRTVVGASE